MAITVPRGALLLYPPHGGVWYERLICAVTHGPYCHVAIALDAAQLVEATGQGIAEGPLPFARVGTGTGPAGGEITVIDLVTYAPPERIEFALRWAAGQVGRQYGWTDIAFQGVKFLWPLNPLELTWNGRWDCSDFATRYLQQAGVALPDPFLDPYKNTPNDLGRAFGLVVPRRKNHPLPTVQPLAPSA